MVVYINKEDVQKTAVDFATKLAGGPTIALSTIKLLTNASLDSDRATAMNGEAMGQEAVMQSEDANEGVAAFVERRDPAYKGW